MKADEQGMSRLMALAQAGDQSAYRALLHASRDWLTGYFRGRIAAVAIDDLVQDTLLSVHAKRATYDPQRPFLPWLAAIARYRWIDQLRRHYRDDADDLLDVHGTDSGEEATLARISIDRMLGRLGRGQAEAIRLVKIDGLSVAEASARCGQSESLIKVNIHRGLKRLARLVESE